MPGGLLDELAPVREDEGLLGIAAWRGNAVDQLCKNNLEEVSLCLREYADNDSLSCRFL